IRPSSCPIAMITSLRTFIAAALLGLYLAPAGLQAAPTTGAAVPKPAAASADSKPADGEAQAKPSLDEQTQTFVANQQESEKRLAELKRQLSDAPRLVGEAQRELARLKSSPQVSVTERYGKSELAQLEKLLDERSNELAEQQNALAEANSLIVTVQTRP